MAVENGSQSFPGKWIKKVDRYYRSRNAVNNYAHFQEFPALYCQSQVYEVYLVDLILNQSARKI